MQGLLGLLLGTLVSYWPIFVREGGGDSAYERGGGCLSEILK